DLLAAVALEDDVEGVLLDSGLGGRATGRAGSRDGDRGGGLDVEDVLERLHELRQLDQRHLLERVEQLVGAELRHVWQPFLATDVNVSYRFAAASGLRGTVLLALRAQGVDQ